jgi:recombination protein RecR
MLPQPIQNLAQKLRAFPGVGSRSSQKLALDFLQLAEADYLELLAAMQTVRREVKFCSNCGFFAQTKDEVGLCEICKDGSRNSAQICLVEKPTDVLSVEKSQVYRGLYHVLNNLISPLDNVFAQDTTLNELIQTRLPEVIAGRQKGGGGVANSQIELILFFKAGFAAEATTAYLREAIANLPKGPKLSITRLAHGLPMYYNPDTLDQATMARALEDRRHV